jgi:MinD superfamily P-loop ATPase
MGRVLSTTTHFGVRSLVCINKADLHQKGVKEIEKNCQEEGIEIVGHIPFDLTVTHAMVQGQPVTAFDPGGPASKALYALWENLAETVTKIHV